MGNIQFISVSPKELADLINEGLKTHIEKLSKQLDPIEKGKEFLTRKETAEFFSISLVCLHDWANKNLVTPYKVGNRTYYKRTELVEILLRSNKEV